MIDALQQEFDKIEAQRVTVLNQTAQLSPAQQTFKPEPGAWCMLEVFLHLITAETNGLKYLKKKMLGDVQKMPTERFLTQVRSVLLKVFLALPVKFKAPAAASFKPRDSYNYHEIKAEWDELRAQWALFLDGVDEKLVTKPLFKHPIAGRINLLQALRFMGQHLEHHKKQLERIQSNPNFPKA